MTCKARQYSDTMHCAKCNLQWDVNDPMPPACRGLHLGPTKTHDLVATLRKCAMDYSRDDDHDSAAQLQEAALLLENSNSVSA